MLWRPGLQNIMDLVVTHLLIRNLDIIHRPADVVRYCFDWTVMNLPFCVCI